MGEGGGGGVGALHHITIYVCICMHVTYVTGALTGGQTPAFFLSHGALSVPANRDLKSEVLLSRHVVLLLIGLLQR